MWHFGPGSLNLGKSSRFAWIPLKIRLFLPSVYPSYTLLAQDWPVAARLGFEASAQSLGAVQLESPCRTQGGRT